MILKIHQNNIKINNRSEVKKLIKKKEKIRQKKYIEKGMSIEFPNKKSKKKGKKHIRKPKMPARIKSTPRERHK